MGLQTLFTSFRPMEQTAPYKNQFLLTVGGGQKNSMEQVCGTK